MSAQAGIRIMVLDDEPFMLMLLSRQLLNLGFTDVTATTAKLRWSGWTIHCMCHSLFCVI